MMWSLYTQQVSNFYYECLVGAPECEEGWYIPKKTPASFAAKFHDDTCPRCGHQLGRTATEQMISARNKRIAAKKQLPSSPSTAQLNKSYGRV